LAFILLSKSKFGIQNVSKFNRELARVPISVVPFLIMGEDFDHMVKQKIDNNEVKGIGMSG
jgi:hypothetical protein